MDIPIQNTGQVLYSVHMTDNRKKRLSCSWITGSGL